ncbi:hypothetical protein J1N35_004978 [Gossypium stocksii]|uniref:Uncharacterized protein n=1 Tax=Gossypium stocksii TaxID=47602 RepID=A0A9D4AIJ3_9ROSI|nr:hypothetical protein J1N35_004978 [Gossypium stocksii]
MMESEGKQGRDELTISPEHETFQEVVVEVSLPTSGGDNPELGTEALNRLVREVLEEVFEARIKVNGCGRIRYLACGDFGFEDWRGGVVSSFAISVLASLVFSFGLMLKDHDRTFRNRCVSNLNLLIGLEAEAKDFTPLSKEHEVQDPCIVVLRVFVDSRSTIYGIDINLNAPPAFKNLKPNPHSQIHLVVIKTDADGGDGYDNNDPFGHEVEYYSDPNLDEVPNDIDDDGTNNDGNVNTSSVGNLSQGIMICNYPGGHMSIIDSNAAHASEFLEYLDILYVQQLVADSARE